MHYLPALWPMIVSHHALYLVSQPGDMVLLYSAVVLKVTFCKYFSPVFMLFLKRMKTPERWRALPRHAIFVSILAQKSSKDVKRSCRDILSGSVNHRIWCACPHRQTHTRTHTQPDGFYTLDRWLRRKKKVLLKSTESHFDLIWKTGINMTIIYEFQWSFQSPGKFCEPSGHGRLIFSMADRPTLTKKGR